MAQARNSMVPDLFRRQAGIRVAERPPADLEVVVPAYNEENRIGETVRSVRRYLERQPYRGTVVVVDNGSADHTVDRVDENGGSAGTVPVRLINCGRRGKGAAVRHAVLTSRARFVGFCDADLATPVDALDTIWPLLNRGAPIVIGSRRAPGAAYVRPQPLLRRLGSLGFRLLARACAPSVADTQCGFKFFRSDVARSLFARARVDRFAFDLELLALAEESRLPVMEVPVHWSDGDRSTFRPLRDGPQAAVDAARVARRRLRTRVRRMLGRERG